LLFIFTDFKKTRPVRRQAKNRLRSGLKSKFKRHRSVQKFSLSLWFVLREHLRQVSCWRVNCSLLNIALSLGQLLDTSGRSLHVCSHCWLTWCRIGSIFNSLLVCSVC